MNESSGEAINQYPGAWFSPRIYIHGYTRQGEVVKGGRDVGGDGQSSACIQL